eukprot:COSAG04_NODE_2028_length_4972_cov_28.991126_2_plen_45_part_00
MSTICPARITRSVLIPASAVNVPMYVPAAPDDTAEKRLAESAPI